MRIPLSFFQFVQPVLPIVLIGGVGVVCVLVAVWSYRHLQITPSWKKTVLTALRALALLILTLLLLHPFFVQEREVEKLPVVHLYVDNSQSITIERGDYEGLADVQALTAGLSESLESRFEVSVYPFGSKVEGEIGNGTGDDVPGNFRGNVAVNVARDLAGTSNRTNLQNVIEHISQFQGEMDVAVLVSDGIFTEGRNPVFSAQSLSSPIYTIPVGDTLETADLVLTAEPIPGQIEAGATLLLRSELRQFGLNDRSVRVRLSVNGSVAFEEEVEFRGSPTLHSFEKEYTVPDGLQGEDVGVDGRVDGRVDGGVNGGVNTGLNGGMNGGVNTGVNGDVSGSVRGGVQDRNGGLVEFLWEVDPLEGELTVENNRVSQLSDIQNRSRTVYSVAFEVHPDVATLRRKIASDTSFELLTADYLRRRERTGIRLPEGSDLLTRTEEPDLIIIHGIPEPGHPFLSWISERVDVPKIWTMTPIGVERLQRSRYNQSVPIGFSGGGGFLRVSASKAPGEKVHPILEFGSPDYRRFPDLMVHQRTPNLPAGSNVLLEAVYAGTETDIPILAVETENSQKRVYLNAFGWNRWEKSTNETVVESFHAMFEYLLSWTITPPGQQQLSVAPAKDTFSNLEPVVWTARLLNERNMPEPDAIVELEIQRTGLMPNVPERAETAVAAESMENAETAVTSETGGNAENAQPVETARTSDSSVSLDRQRFRMRHDENGVYRLDAGRFPEGNYRVRAFAMKGSRQLGTAESQFRVGSSPEEFINTRRNDALLEQVALATGGSFVERDPEGDPIQGLMQQLERDGISRLQVETSFLTRYLIDWPVWFALVLLLLSGEWLLRRSLSLP